MYVLLAIMGFFLYNTMKRDPGFVSLNPDLVTAKKVSACGQTHMALLGMCGCRK